jgi:hypothetical protein
MEFGMVELLDYKFDMQIFCMKLVLCVRKYQRDRCDVS